MVFNGIDLSNCIPKNDYSFGENINILHVGRFNYQKNHEGILRSFVKVAEKFPSARLNLYGAGELEQSCRELCRELSLENNVRFCGTTDDIYSVMSKSDMFMLCSHYEGMPITLIEAMATGLPIVATPVGGVVDMIEHEKHGLLCRDDADDIADAVIRTLSDRALREECGKAAMERSVCFSADVMTDGYIDIYNKVLKQ
jgi:glycosyltransferase involved in cell wall biosynthesis